MSKEWFYDKAGEQVGPVTELNLKESIQAGTIAKGTLVWSEGMADWCAADQCLPHLFAPGQLDVTEAYKASAVSQPVLRGEAYSMTPTQVLFSFNGRIRRTTYWGYSIGAAIAFLAPMFAAMAIFGEESDASLIVMGVMFIPFVWTSLAIRVKRWHDRGKSGAWVLISMIPYIGDIWAFIENGCLEGDHGSNAYGPDPKG